jgi:hypothetical protein
MRAVLIQITRAMTANHTTNDPEPDTLNLKPQTLNPELCTLKPSS